MQPGESREVTFEITEEMLRFYNIDMEYVAEPGRFEVYIGGSSDAEQKASNPGLYRAFTEDRRKGRGYESTV